MNRVGRLETWGCWETGADGKSVGVKRGPWFSSSPADADGLAKALGYPSQEAMLKDIPAGCEFDVRWGPLRRRARIVAIRLP